jgi:hypothetical protein
MKSAEPRPKHARAYRVSGFHGMQAALTKRGLSALDGRSASARHVARWKADVTADLGGDLSTAKKTLIEVAAMDVALLAVADSWLRENAASVLNKRKRTFVPLVAERLRVAAHLADVLKLLGLERKARELPTLAQYLQEREAAQEPPAEAPVAEEQAEPAEVFAVMTARGREQIEALEAAGEMEQSQEESDE